MIDAFTDFSLGVLTVFVRQIGGGMQIWGSAWWLGYAVLQRVSQNGHQNSYHLRWSAYRWLELKILYQFFVFLPASIDMVIGAETVAPKNPPKVSIGGGGYQNQYRSWAYDTICCHTFVNGAEAILFP